MYRKNGKSLQKFIPYCFLILFMGKASSKTIYSQPLQF